MCIQGRENILIIRPALTGGDTGGGRYINLSPLDSNLRYLTVSNT